MLVAAIEPRDEHHQPCAQLLAGAREVRVVPAPVLVELEYLLRAASDVDAFKALAHPGPALVDLVTDPSLEP